MPLLPPSTSGGVAARLRGGGENSQAALMASPDRQRHCCSSTSHPLRHLRASNSDPLSRRKERNNRGYCSSRIKGTNSRRELLLSGAALLVVSQTASGAAAASSPASPSSPPSTSSLDSIRSAYDSYSADYDSLDGGAIADLLGFTRLRAEAVGLARGRVLELGVGTGLNLPFYYSDSDSSTKSTSSISSVTAVDLSQGMLSVAKKRIEDLGLGRNGSGENSSRSSPPPPVLVAADAAALPFEDSSFDIVLDTFSLCVFPEPLKALVEARRVLVKGSGKLVLVEHSRVSKNKALALYQDATAGLIASGNGGGKGCVWNQDVPELLREAGFEVEKEERVAGGTVGLFVCRVK